MSNTVKIESILDFLDTNNYKYLFQGNENDNIEGFSTLFNYRKDSLTFVSKLYKFSDYLDLFSKRKIKLIITDPSEDIFDCFENVIQIEKPTNAFFSILEIFFSDNSTQINNPITKVEADYKNNSYISDKAIIGKNVKIGIGCVIEADVSIGDNTEIHHNVVIRRKTKIGKNCTIFSGAIIGERGFNPLTLEDKNRKMLNHYGGVTIEDNVHIGVNCSVNQGSIDDTIIKEGAKLNTMVHVAHNCIVGKNTVITMPTQICGSVIIGDNCHIGSTTIRNQCKVGDNAILGLGSVVVKDVDAGLTVVGNPAKPLRK